MAGMTMSVLGGPGSGELYDVWTRQEQTIGLAPLNLRPWWRCHSHFHKLRLLRGKPGCELGAIMPLYMCTRLSFREVS